MCQSVSDTLKKVRAELDGFEEKLGVTNRRLRLTAFADTLPEKEKNKLLDILEK